MNELFLYLNSLKHTMNEHPLFSVGTLLIVGYIIGKLSAKVKLPEITGFIIAGILLGDSVLQVIPHHMNESLRTITEVALGLIALTIGGEFYWKKLKRMGKAILIITVVQILFTFLSVTISLWIFKLDLPFALLLGAIAAATAPAATVAIVQSLRAHGVFIDYLYGVVALDDAGCVILFGVVFAIVSGMLNPGGNESSFVVVMHAFMEVAISITIGLVSGYIIHITTRKKNNNNEILIISLGIIFISTATAIIFHMSPLLMNMAAGAILINLSPRNHRIFRILEPLSPPVYALFFVIAGTELQPEIFMNKSVLLLGSVYILFRAIGKYTGVYTGCLISGSQSRIRKYLGVCMLPQAGVAIGLVLLIQASPLVKLLPADQVVIIDNMINIVLLSVFVNELIGPSLSRYAIIRGNDMEK